ncbi:MAG: NAD(P)/FAD-dependent oxidoreductase [Polyangiales bacterium]
MSASKEADPSRHVLIVGAGFAGIGMAIRLLEEGVETFTIVEASDDVGGVWRDNTYPGAACDVMSHLYSFSFEPWSGWTRQFARQGEIRRYLRRCFEKHGLGRFTRFETRVTRGEYDAERGIWTAHTEGGEAIEARVVVSGVGTFGRPQIPEIPGLAGFDGPVMHSAKWDHAARLEGKRVAVVGTGASAVQVVPELAKVASRLTVFQRTPAWVPMKPDRDIGPLERALYELVPAAQRAQRSRIYWTNELLDATAFIHAPRLRRLGERLALRNLRKHIADPALREKLTPRYEMGCKRVLPSNQFYPALALPHVELVAEGLAEVRGNTLVGEQGAAREVDAVVFCTGFQVVDQPAPFALLGRDGVDLRARWAREARAYLGTTVPGFPNLFILTGPNTGLGHSSMVFMMEAQFEYVLGALRCLRDRGLRAVEVREDALAGFVDEMERRAGGTTWRSGCKSWYLNRDGKSVGLWPGYTFEYRRRTARFDVEHYRTDPDAMAAR